MAKEKHVREIVVTDQKVIHKGTNRSNGSEYTIYQVIATNRNGQLIDKNLRSFDELPKNQVIRVEVERFNSDRWGESFTLTLEGKKKGAGLGKKVDALEARVKKLEEALARLGQQQNGSAPAQASAAPAPPAQQSPGPPTPPPQPRSDGLPSDDIPF